LVLLAVAGLVAVPSLLVVDGIAFDDARSASPALVGVTGEPDAVVATPARSHPVLAAVPGLPLGIAAAVAASVIRRGRRHTVTGLRFRLDDVGDGWRALLLGAPPILL
jgi:hypothetical protein